MRYAIAVNTENCMACYNCVVACKDEHCGFATSVSAPQPHEGQFWVRIESRERGDDNRKVKTSNVAVMCSHCKEPACAKAAENGAVYRRDDGIVIIDPEKARGQRQIVDACPAGAVFWNEKLSLPQKCTMCAHLIDEGYAQPRCVEACPNGALYFGDLDDPESEVSRVIAENIATPLSSLGGAETNVKYLNIPTVFLAGSVYTSDDDAVDGASVVLTERSTGKRLELRTNYFGDWEAERLEKGAVYDIEIAFPGYDTAAFAAEADTDHYVGETILKCKQ